MIPHVVLCLAYQRERMAYQNSSSNSYIVVQWSSDIICEMTTLVISQMISLRHCTTCINLIGNGNGKLWHAYTEGMHNYGTGT